MRPYKTTLSRTLSLLLALCMTVLPVLTTIVQAQSNDFDLDGPTIEHDRGEYDATATVQVFSASVVDNDTVSSVRLFYRLASDSDFVDKAMTQIAQSSVYTTSVDIADTPDAQIEYYIQAEDSAGNVVLEGYAFSPNTRILTTEQPSELALELTEEQETTGIIVANEPEAQSEPDKQLEVKKRSNVLYYVLGALAVGAVAAAASGGSSDSGNNPRSDDPDVTCCTVTVEIADP